MDTIMEGIFVFGIILIVLLFGLGVYFLPTILAVAMHNHNALAIFLLNFFTGWSGIGWLASLIWAVIV